MDKAEAYAIGIVTCLAHERAAVKAMLDEEHDPPTDFNKSADDDNVYTWGKIGDHNLVIASLPEGMYGISAAAICAHAMSESLPHIRLGLLVGIGAGLPGQQYDQKAGKTRPKRDIKLGDVIVSRPDANNGGVIQFDAEKIKKVDGGIELEQIDNLKPPPTALLNALTALKAAHEMEDSALPVHLAQALVKYPKMTPKFSYPPEHPNGKSQPEAEYTDDEEDEQGKQPVSVTKDKYFRASYQHTGEEGCEKCDPKNVIHRRKRDSSHAKIFYGTIASGNKVIKDAEERDAIVHQLEDNDIELLCIEMEAAGLMNTFPCIVIRGISDYGDSHKNDMWQRYAALTAAAFAKEFLSYVDVQQMERGPYVGDLMAIDQ